MAIHFMPPAIISTYARFAMPLCHTLFMLLYDIIILVVLPLFHLPPRHAAMPELHIAAICQLHCLAYMLLLIVSLSLLYFSPYVISSRSADYIEAL